MIRFYAHVEEFCDDGDCAYVEDVEPVIAERDALEHKLERIREILLDLRIDRHNAMIMRKPLHDDVLTKALLALAEVATAGRVAE